MLARGLVSKIFVFRATENIKPVLERGEIDLKRLVNTFLDWKIISWSKTPKTKKITKIDISAYIFQQ